VSELGTRIICAGLVDDGMAVEDMERELAKLRELVTSTRPVCPVCKSEMNQKNYQGYYDSFSYWGCDCVEFPGANTWSGAYA
jgi:transposase-like protein